MVESGSDPRAKGPVRSLLSTTDTSVNKIKMWNSVFPITRIIREQRTETKQPSLILEHSRVGQWICYVYMFVGEYTYFTHNLCVSYALIYPFSRCTCMYISTEPYTSLKFYQFYSYRYWFQLDICLPLKESSCIKDIIAMFLRRKNIL